MRVEQLEWASHALRSPTKQDPYDDLYTLVGTARRRITKGADARWSRRTALTTKRRCAWPRPKTDSHTDTKVRPGTFLNEYICLFVTNICAASTNNSGHILPPVHLTRINRLTPEQLPDYANRRGFHRE